MEAGDLHDEEERHGGPPVVEDRALLRGHRRRRHNRIPKEFETSADRDNSEDEGSAPTLATFTEQPFVINMPVVCLAFLGASLGSVLERKHVQTRQTLHPVLLHEIGCRRFVKIGTNYRTRNLRWLALDWVRTYFGEQGLILKDSSTLAQ